MTDARPPLLDGDALTAFLAFAEVLNFTRAAAHLHVSQPALHARIKKLGEGLGVSLYRREGRRLVLTHAGESLLRFGRETEGRTREFLADLHGHGARAPVVLAAGEGSFLYLLGVPIRRFVRSKAAPLRLLTRDREGLLAALRSGEAQLGVTALDQIPDELDGVALRDAAQILVLPSKHPLADCEGEIELAALDGQRMIVAARGRPHRETFAQAMTNAGASWEPAVEVHGWPAMLHCVRLGLGLAVVNETVTLPRGLVGRPIPALPTNRYQLLRARHLSASAQALDALIRELV